MTSISMFDSWGSVLASNDAAKTFIRNRLADMLPEPAEAVGGEVILDGSRRPALG